MYNFDTIVERRGTDSNKWSEEGNFEMFGAHDMLPFWVADMDFPAAPAIRTALEQRVAHGVYGYRSGNGHNEAQARWVGRRFDWQIDPSWICNASGVVAALRLAINAYTKPGDKVLIQQPVYYPFVRSIEFTGRRAVSNDLVEGERGYTIDFEDFERKTADPDVTMFILCSPHNPVGRVWAAEELARMAEICLANNVLVVSDEIHNDLIMPGHTHHVLAALDERFASNTVTCMSPSKTFNLAGIQHAGVIIPDEKLRREFAWELRRTGAGSPNLFGCTAAQAAWNESEEWLDELLVYLGGNLQFAQEFIGKNLPRVKLYEHQGTYLMWMNFRDYGLSDEDLQEAMYRKARLALDAGSWFGGDSEGFMRLNFACPRPMLTEGLECMAETFNAIG